MDHNKKIMKDKNIYLLPTILLFFPFEYIVINFTCLRYQFFFFLIFEGLLLIQFLRHY
jgi:hypothetical protein